MGRGDSRSKDPGHKAMFVVMSIDGKTAFTVTSVFGGHSLVTMSDVSKGTSIGIFEVDGKKLGDALMTAAEWGAIDDDD